MDSKAVKLLTTFSWKGNVRELRNVIERLTILSENNNINSDDVKKFSGK
jgi:DNA-binding NtrC family response regulator